MIRKTLLIAAATLAMFMMAPQEASAQRCGSSRGFSSGFRAPVYGRSSSLYRPSSNLYRSSYRGNSLYRSNFGYGGGFGRYGYGYGYGNSVGFGRRGVGISIGF